MSTVPHGRKHGFQERPQLTFHSFVSRELLGPAHAGPKVRDAKEGLLFTQHDPLTKT